MLYGKQVDSFVSQRKVNDGEFGYEVYAEDKVNGTTTSLGFTTTSAMKVDKPSNDTIYYVKTGLQYLGCTRSSGISVEVKGTKKEEEKPTSMITYSVNGNSNDSATVNTSYQDPGIVVYADAVDVTSKSTITVTCPELGTSKDQKESYTFTSAGTYTLKYTINYNGQTETATRTITVTE